MKLKLSFEDIKKYIPFAAAIVLLIVTFFVSFGISKSAKLKKLRAADGETVSASDGQSEAQAVPAAATPAKLSTPLTEMPTPQVISMPENELWSVVLINITHQVTADYKGPAVSEVAEGSDIVLETRVAEAYKKMVAAAAEENIAWQLDRGYISIDRQDRAYEDEVARLVKTGMSEENARLEATFTVLPGRCCESCYGLSIDVNITDEAFTSGAVYKWLRENASAYGFIERYPAGKEEITYMKANPHHWRYVGADASVYLASNALTLEEYKQPTE